MSDPRGFFTIGPQHFDSTADPAKALGIGAATLARVNARHSFIKFLVVGSLATAIHYAIFYALYQLAELPALLSTSVGFTVSAIFNFTASYRFTFRSRARWEMAALRYVLTAGTGLLINALVFSVLHEWAGLGASGAQVLATGVVLVWNYLGGRYFTFVGEKVKT